MARGLRYTDTARDDLDAIWRWQTQSGAGRAALRRVRAIRDKIERLRDNPCLYPVGDHSGVRELPCDDGYRVLYEVDPDSGRNDTAGGVRVLRVFGPGQDRGRF